MQAAAVTVNGAGDVQKPQQQPMVVGAPPPPAMVPPHWVAIPMPPHPMAPPQFAAAHFVPFHAVVQSPPRAATVPAVVLGSPAPHQAGQEENKTIWVGDLHFWMDENYLHNCFGYTGEVSTDATQPRSWPRPCYSRVSPREKNIIAKQMFLLHSLINLSFLDVTNPCCFLAEFSLRFSGCGQERERVKGFRSGCSC